MFRSFEWSRPRVRCCPSARAFFSRSHGFSRRTRGRARCSPVLWRDRNHRSCHLSNPWACSIRTRKRVMNDEKHKDAAWVAEMFTALRTAISAIVIGNDEAVRLSFVTLLCSGHSLYEGVPGVAKTLLVRTLAATLGIRFGRIQCTPDLMPSDIIGTPILLPEQGDFRFRPGPLFTDLLLVDEINRAPAKTQAALLEAMQERAAAVDGIRYALGEWFTVLATQNPIEQEGTYPLPEAELDRFLFKIRVGYPTAEEEVRILATHHVSAAPPVSAVLLSANELGHARVIADAAL